MSWRFVEIADAPACCISAQAQPRTTAARFLVGRCELPAVLELAAGRIAEAQTQAPPGRVCPSGRFIDDDARERLAAALPPALRSALHPEFEWYACRGAHFHTDAHYGDVLFGAWCAAGPARDLVFARVGARLPAGPGTFVVFDPFEPHAVLDRGQLRYERRLYAAAAANVFVGFELALDEATADAFGTRRLASRPATLRELSSRIAVNAETGAFDEAD